MDGYGNNQQDAFKDADVVLLAPISFDVNKMREALHDVYARLKDRTDMWNALAVIEQALSADGTIKTKKSN